MAQGEMERRIIEMHNGVNRIEEKIHGVQRCLTRQEEQLKGISLRLDNHSKRIEKNDVDIDSLKWRWVPIVAFLAALLAYAANLRFSP